MVIIDTSLIIDHLRQGQLQDSFLMKVVETEDSDTLFISMATLQELYAGKSTRDELAEESLINTLAGLGILPYEFDTAEMAGKLTRDLGMSFVDASIAATSIINSAKLYTLNTKDFALVPKLELGKL